MTDLVSSILSIASVLAFYADRLPLMRGSNTNEQELTRGYLAADSTGMAYRSVRPWYKFVEPLYAELEMLMQTADDNECATLLKDPTLPPLMAKLHRTRAAYEFDKEMTEAENLLNEPDAAHALSAMIDHQSYWTLSQPVIEALKNAKQVAVIGSGPLPLTALALASKTSCHITCFERDQTAFEIGNQVLNLSPYSNRITRLNQGTTSSDAFTDFDVIFTTVLMGVSMDDEAHWSKAEAIETFFKAGRPNLSLIMRDPYRLGVLFYPSAGVESLPFVQTDRYDPQAGPGVPYRSAFLILRERVADG